MFHRRYFEHRHHAKLFEKGDLKYVILDLIKDKPSHGYEIIRALGERFHGFYSPSAGSVYPTLQLLEDMGHVTSSEQDGKRVYTVTKDGKQFLKDRGETIDKIKGHMRDWGHPGNNEEIRDVMHEIGGLGRTIMHKMGSMSPEQIKRLKEIILQVRHDIDAL